MVNYECATGLFARKYHRSITAIARGSSLAGVLTSNFWGRIRFALKKYG